MILVSKYMSEIFSNVEDKSIFKEIARHCAKFKGADLKRSLIQLISTSLLFFAAISGMIISVQQGYWLVYALLLVPAAGLLVRLFIIQHDCGHGSYMRTRQGNDMLGRLISVLTWTPYGFWRRTHNIHHAGSGHLERRGYGGIETLTIEEYKNLSARQKIIYRLYRNPFLLLVIGTPVFIIFAQRLPFTEPFPFPEFAKSVELKGVFGSVMGLNVAIIIFYGFIGSLTGFIPLLIAYMPVLFLTSCIGGWLFFIQHQFEDTLWDNQKEWTFEEAALMGSSYYDLHPILQWFTGNIGIHHIHHLCAMIPNYRLQECLDSREDLKTINRLTFKESLKCVNLALWDEKQRKLVSFREALV